MTCKFLCLFYPAGSLAAAMEEAGPSCTSSQPTFRELQEKCAPLDEAAAAHILALVAWRHGGKTDTDESSQVTHSWICMSPHACACHVVHVHDSPGQCNRLVQFLHAINSLAVHCLNL